MAEQDTGLAPEAAPETQQPPEGATAAPEDKPARTYTQAEVDEIASKIKAAQRAKAYRQQQKLRAQLESMPVAHDEPPNGQDEVLKRKEDEAYEDFVERKAAVAATHAARRALQEENERRRFESEVRTLEEVAANWSKRKEEGAKKYADFDEVTGRDDLMISFAMGRSIQESDIGHEIAYYLAKHPDEAEDIAGKSISGQIRAIGRIEEKLEQPKAPTRQPSAPITPVEGRQPSNSLMQKLMDPRTDNDEWNRQWDALQAQKARERAGR